MGFPWLWRHPSHRRVNRRLGRPLRFHPGASPTRPTADQPTHGFAEHPGPFHRVGVLRRVHGDAAEHLNDVREIRIDDVLSLAEVSHPRPLITGEIRSALRETADRTPGYRCKVTREPVPA